MSNSVWCPRNYVNPFSKYMFLFRAYWTKLDHSALYLDTGAMFGHFIYTRIGFEVLKNEKPGHRIFADIEDFIKYSPQNLIHRFFVNAGPMIYHLRDFGFWECEEAIIQKLLPRKNDPDIKAVTPSAFGLAMIRACLTRPYEVYNEKPDTYLIKKVWHEERLEPILRQLDIKTVPAGAKKEPFENAFAEIFAEGTLDTTAINKLFSNLERPVDAGGNVYVLKVTYRKGVWRRIKLSSTHTLHHLHEAIQEAYCFGDDHLYAFFMDGKPWSGEAYYSPFDDEPPYADRTLIGKLGLKRGQAFLYLFDYGDEWKFNIKVEEVLLSDAPPFKPVIIASRGAAPEQYPDSWEEEEDFRY